MRFFLDQPEARFPVDSEGRGEHALGPEDDLAIAGGAGEPNALVNQRVSEAHAADSKAQKLTDLLHYSGDMLLPQMTIKEAVAMFETAEADALAVVDGPESLRVIGLLTEQYALRRYSEELDRRRRELSGE